MSERGYQYEIIIRSVESDPRGGVDMERFKIFTKANTYERGARHIAGYLMKTYETEPCYEYIDGKRRRVPNE
jgi:hypothetical protein